MDCLSPGRTFAFLGLGGGRRRARRRRIARTLESLESRDLLSLASNALPPALGSRLASVTLVQSPGPHVVGEPIRFTSVLLAGEMGLPTELEQVTIQMKVGRGPWVNAGTSLPHDDTVTLFAPTNGRLRFRAVATVLVDADAAHEDPSEDEPGFDDVLDLTGLSPRAAYRKAVQVANSGSDIGDTQLAFLSPVIGVQVLLAATPVPEPPADASDGLTITANGVSDGGQTAVPNPPIYTETVEMVNGKPVTTRQFVKRGKPAFNGTLKEGPNDTDAPSSVLTAGGIFSEAPPRMQRTIEFPEGQNISTRAIALMDAKNPKQVSDVIVLTVTLGVGPTPKPDGNPYNFYTFSVTFTSDGGGKPLNVFFTPKPVKGKPQPPAPEGAIVVPPGTEKIQETGKFQDITAFLFPEYYKTNKDGDLVKNDKGGYTLNTTSRLPPLIVKAFSDAD